MNFSFLKPIYWVGLWLLICISALFLFDGTADSGDSILHYLFAKEAVNHPELFFNHWAKPLYVLIMSPFAQFGFIGVKIANVLFSSLTILLSFLVTKNLKLSNYQLTPLFLIFSPLYISLTLSGLTEPLFALVLIFSLYVFQRKQLYWGTIIIGFLPFVRSEGLFFLPIAAVFLLHLKGKSAFKFIPVLLVGHALYSLAGFFIYHDILWVFTKIPYAKLSSTYGEGKLFHFVNQMNYVIGFPIYMLLTCGLIAQIRKLLVKKSTLFELYFILGGFLAFFVAHSLFWYLGIFNSMGLKRVLIGVLPLIAIISLYGINLILELIKNRRVKIVTCSLLIILVLIFPFTKNPAALNIEKDLKKSKDLNLIETISKSINPKKQCNFYAHPYFSIALNVDHFNRSQHMEPFIDFQKEMKKGDKLLWDSWFCPIEFACFKEDLLKDTTLQALEGRKVFYDNREFEVIIFEKK
jgi:hypothetical protein